MTADPLMVAALLDGLGRPGYDDLLAEASGADVCAAAQALARAARPPRSLLQATYRELTGLADDAWSKAKALRWLADRLYPVWACRPDTPLGDVLKRRGPDEVDWIRATLADARIDLDR